MRRRRAAYLSLCLGLVPWLSGFEWAGHIHRLEQDLATGDAEQRRETLRLLAHYPAERVGTLLMNAFGDPDTTVRAEAARAAGRVGLTQAIPTLLEWLEDPEPEIRASAAEALGDLHNERSLSALVRSLGDSNVTVRRAAIDALRKLGTDEVVVPIAGRLDDDDTSIRIEAANALAELRDSRSVVPLIGRARDDTPEVRIAIAAALGRLGDARAAPALLQGTEDTNDAVVIAAIGALGQVESELGTAALVSMLDDQDPRIATAALSALGAIGSDRALDALVQALNRVELRDAATDVLSATSRRRAPFGDSAFAAELTRRLAVALEGTSGEHHARRICDVLAVLPRNPESLGAAQSLLRQLRASRFPPGSLLMGLALHGDASALLPLLEHLSDPDPNSQHATLAALAAFFDSHPADGRAADPIASALETVSVADRVLAIELLGRVGASRTVPVLRPLLRHEDLNIRLAAIRALGGVNDAAVTQSLLELLSDPNARVRYAAAEAIDSSAPSAAIGTILERLASPEPQDRHALLIALTGALENRRNADLDPDVHRRALTALVAIADQDDTALAARAIEALGRSRDGATIPAIVSLIATGTTRTQRLAIRALGYHDDPTAIAALRSQLDNPSTTIVAETAAALGHFGDASDVDRLIALAANGRFPASAAAAFALARLARRGVLGPDRNTELCGLLTRRDPYTRSNIAIALTTLRLGCAAVASSSWYSLRSSPMVREAAVRWLAALTPELQDQSESATRILRECILRDLDASVVAACRDPALPPFDRSAGIYAYSADGRTLLRDRLIGLRFADGTVLVTHADPNGRIYVDRAPRGPLRLEDPTTSSLEPE